MSGWCSPTPQPSPINPTTVVVPPGGEGWMAGGEELIGSESLAAGDDRGI